MNVKKILDYFHINYVIEHPEVSKSCYGVDCPFCGDKNKHCGIFITTGYFSCWKCGRKGSLYSLLKEIKHISFNNFKMISGIRDHSKGSKAILDDIFEKKEGTIMSEKVDLTPYLSAKPVSERVIPVVNQSKSRKLDTLKRFKARECVYGDFSQRLLFPIYADSGMVGFIGRDLTGIAKKKYLIPENFRISNYLYQTRYFVVPDFLKLIIVEGVFDAIAVSEYGNGIALFGKNMSKRQCFEIIQLGVYNSVEVILDSDALQNARKIAAELRTYFHNVTIYHLKEGDPASNIGKIYENSRKITVF